MEGRLVDYSEHFPKALLAQGKGSTVLILTKLDKPFKRFDGKKAEYELHYRSLSQVCKNPEDEAYVCVEGSENTYWQEKEIASLLAALRKGGEVSLFDHFDLF